VEFSESEDVNVAWCVRSIVAQRSAQLGAHLSSTIIKPPGSLAVTTRALGNLGGTERPLSRVSDEDQHERSTRSRRVR